MGYCVAWTILSTVIAVTTLPFVPFLNFIFGSCWLFIFMAQDIAKDLTSFNDDLQKKLSNGNENGAVKIRKRICEIVQLYTDAKQLVLN